jgi:hypothetical protein
LGVPAATGKPKGFLFTDMEKHEIYNMELNEILDITPKVKTNLSKYIHRVPGGWVYLYYLDFNGTRKFTSVFVPFNNEFMNCFHQVEKF